MCGFNQSRMLYTVEIKTVLIGVDVLDATTSQNSASVLAFFLFRDVESLENWASTSETIYIITALHVYLEVINKYH